MQVICASEKDKDRWDEYVLNQKDSTPYHLFGWKGVIEKTYHHETRYLMVLDDETRVRGILPLTIIKSLFFGRFAVSVAFCNYGGICAGDVDSENALMEKAEEIAIEQKLRYLELRHYAYHDLDLALNDIYVTSILRLDEDCEVVFRGFKKNKRSTIKKSQKRNLNCEWNNTRAGDFFSIYSHNMRDLGSPTHSLVFFESVVSYFPDNVKLLTVFLHAKPVYSSFLFFFKDTVYSIWSSARRSFRQYYPTDFGIWETVKYGCENGYRYYDFGRSQPNSANLEFKRRWGASDRKLYYQYYLNKGNSIYNYSFGWKENVFMAVWKRMPVRLTRSLGPKLRRSVP